MSPYFFLKWNSDYVSYPKCKQYLKLSQNIYNNIIKNISSKSKVCEAIKNKAWDSFLWILKKNIKKYILFLHYFLCLS